jgi:dTDP-glucose 4,6-dehydratase
MDAVPPEAMRPRRSATILDYCQGQKTTMRILISGGAGFIGSHLTDLLLEQGHSVVAVDNFITGKPQNIAHLRGHDRYQFIQHDITEPLEIDGPVDRIYNLASPASPIGYIQHQIATLKTNSQGCWNMLELALRTNARFLMASTSETYGDPAVHPQREDYWGNVNPIGLRSMYDEAKRFAEACTMAYHRERKADTRLIRLFNTYGPRMDPYDGRVVISFIRQALNNEPVTVFGEGQQTRSLCYVSDMVRGINAAMEGDFIEPINLGNPEEVTILQIAREILELVPDTKSQIVFKPMPPDDPRLRCPDITRARQILGWSPRVSRKEGLASMIRHYTTQLRNPPEEAQLTAAAAAENR